jgi:hypothetical protein
VFPSLRRVTRRATRTRTLTVAGRMDENYSNRIDRVSASRPRRDGEDSSDSYGPSRLANDADDDALTSCVTLALRESTSTERVVSALTMMTKILTDGATSEVARADGRVGEAVFVGLSRVGTSREDAVACLSACVATASRRGCFGDATRNKTVEVVCKLTAFGRDEALRDVGGGSGEDDDASVEDGQRYRPPHARASCPVSTSNEVHVVGCSDEDVRVSAANALAALAKGDEKALREAWTHVFPTAERQLQSRSLTTTAVQALALDPSARVRASVANACAVIFESAATKSYLAIAEKRSSDGASARGAARVRSFSALSTTLGDMVVTTQRCILRALERESSAQCVRELSKALSALCAATPYDRLPSGLLVETAHAIHGRVKELERESANERAIAQGALFGALTSALSVTGDADAVAAFLRDDGASLSQTLLAHAVGHAGSARCEAYGVFRTILTHHATAGIEMRETLECLFPAVVCAQSGGVDDRISQASARLFADYLAAASGSHSSHDDDEVDIGAVVAPSAVSEDALRKIWMDAIDNQLPVCTEHPSALTRVAGMLALTRVNLHVVDCLRDAHPDALRTLIAMPHKVLDGDREKAAVVCAAASRSLGFLTALPPDVVDLEAMASSLLRASADKSKSVKIAAVWSLANLAAVNAQKKEGGALSEATVSALARVFIEGARQGDKVRANATRGIGHLIASVAFTSSTDWLGEAAQSLASCLTTGNAKTQWNACLAIASLFGNDSAINVGSSWIAFMIRMLLLCVRDASNFKIRMHAAAALAVAASQKCLFSTYFDVLSILTSSMETLSKQNTAGFGLSQGAMDFKYKPGLMCQLTVTLACLLSNEAPRDEDSLDVLKKKRRVVFGAFAGLSDYFDRSSDAKVRMNPRFVKGFDAASPVIARDVLLGAIENVASALNCAPDVKALEGICIA